MTKARRWYWLGIGLLALASAGQASDMTAAEYFDEPQLAALLWQRSSEVLEARAAVAAAESERRRAFLYPNPTLDFGWNTIPVGRTNPPGLEDRWSKVPNYAVSVAELVELGKRGPRQRALTWDRERARWQLVAIFGDRFFALLEAAGRLAANQRKLHLLGELVQDTSELLELDRARASRGEIPALDVDIAAVELARLVANRDQVQADLNQARADCSALIALSCPLFPSPEAATEFLERAAAASFDEGWSEAAEQRRPDLSALAAALSAAQERVVLAHRKVIPDLTLRAGYTYDQFTVSGNQRNSVAVGVSLPLPVADRGQADLFAAQAEAARARQLRARLLESIPQQIEAARQQRALARERKERLDGALEKARAARDAVAAAQQAGGISLIEVLVARRNYLELLRERADVDFDAFAATLALRKLLGLFPRPPEANADGGFTLP